jgi:hypothetical protein
VCTATDAYAIPRSVDELMQGLGKAIIVTAFKRHLGINLHEIFPGMEELRKNNADAAEGWIGRRRSALIQLREAAQRALRALDDGDLDQGVKSFEADRQLSGVDGLFTDEISDRYLLSILLRAERDEASFRILMGLLQGQGMIVVE